MTASRIIIVGPGALGCGMAALLSQRGADVALLDYRPERAAELRRAGIRVEQEGRRDMARVEVSASARELGHAALLVVLVKAYATAQAAAHALPLVERETAVLTLQNGLGNYEALAAHMPPRQVLAGTVVMGCAAEGVGQARISGVGPIALGSPFGNDELAHRVADLLGELWPHEVNVEERIETALWRKVIINAAINPLTALTGLRNGALLEDEGLRRALALIAREARMVAAACGVEGLPADPAPVVEEVCRLTAQNRSSMLQDVTAGRRTEIEQICGEVARRAEAAGIEAPLCELLTALVPAAAGGLPPA